MLEIFTITFILWGQYCICGTNYSLIVCVLYTSLKRTKANHKITTLHQFEFIKIFVYDYNSVIVHILRYYPS